MKTYYVDVKETTIVTYRVFAESEELARDYFFDGDTMHTEYLNGEIVGVEEEKDE